MKQTFFKLSGVFFLLLFSLNGCKKDDSVPDPLKKVVSVGKQITYFKIVTPAATGIIDTVNRIISVAVPIGTNLTGLVTDISLAASHTINPASGQAQNFSTPVVYTVKRPDNTTTTWTVAVGSAGVNVDQDITSSVTWTADKTYFITGDIYIGNNSVLTIQPGTVIKFSAGASLSIGDGSNATLIANGTAANPIIFTSSALAPAAGAWKGLFFDSNTLNNSSLSYCNIQYAGSNTNYGALNIDGCDLSMSNCSISTSGSYGIWTNYSNSLGGFSTFNNNTVNTTAKYGMVINAQKLGTVGTGNSFTNCFGILIYGDFKSTSAQTWKNLNIPYIIENEVDIDGNLTIEPGTQFRFEANGWLALGYYAATTLIADGTSSLPIKFTSNASSPVAGSWSGITFYGYTQTNSKMNYCIIDYAGSNSNYGSLHMEGNASIIFTNNTIRNSSSYGIVADANAGFQTFTGNTIFSCVNHLISISTAHLPDLGTPNTFTAETGKGILVSGGIKYTSDVIWKKQTADFYISGGENDIDGNVTIEAGSNFLFVNDSYFWFGYYANTKITAVGTTSAHITFTSAGSSPAAGAWRGIIFDTYTQTNTSLSYCDFLYTGLNNKPAIYTAKPILVGYTNISNFSSTHAAEYKTGITLVLGLGNNFTWAAN
jgi:Right handed beta helix region